MGSNLTFHLAIHDQLGQWAHKPETADGRCSVTGQDLTSSGGGGQQQPCGHQRTNMLSASQLGELGLNKKYNATFCTFCVLKKPNTTLASLRITMPKWQRWSRALCGAGSE